MELGIDIMILLPNSTHFMQPWDQIFNAVEAKYRDLITALAATEGFSATLSRPDRLALIDSAIHAAFTNKPNLLSDAFTKTGLWPHC